MLGQDASGRSWILMKFSTDLSRYLHVGSCWWLPATRLCSIARNRVPTPRLLSMPETRRPSSSQSWQQNMIHVYIYICIYIYMLFSYKTSIFSLLSLIARGKWSHMIIYDFQLTLLNFLGRWMVNHPNPRRRFLNEVSKIGFHMVSTKIIIPELSPIQCAIHSE